MRLVLDTAKVSNSVSKFFRNTVDTVQTKRLERCARILANAEIAKVDRIIVTQSKRVATKRLAVKR